MSCDAAENVWDGGDAVVEHKPKRKKLSPIAASAAHKVLHDRRSSEMARRAACRALGRRWEAL